MAKTNSPVSYGGSVQNFFDLLSSATRKQGGNLGEAIVLLGKPENSGAIDELAGITARVSKQHQAALEVAERVRVVNKTTIEVNLASPPKLPFDSAAIEHNAGGGWVRVEKKKDGHLYIDGKKFLLHLEGGQKTGVIVGKKLREMLAGKSVLHPNIMDALFDYQHLIPDYCKQDERGRTRYIFFWGVVYRGSDGDLYVRCLYWLDGAWRRNYRWLDVGFDVRRPAPVSASNT